MVEIPDQLRCLFTATPERSGDSYRIEIPREEVKMGELNDGETYRVAVLPQASPQSGTIAQSNTGSENNRDQHSPPDENTRAPPVEPGDQREVTIDSLGDQGDGIAKVDRGYVVIVPGARPDDEVTVEIEEARENVAFARVLDDETDDSAELTESTETETVGETDQDGETTGSDTLL